MTGETVVWALVLAVVSALFVSVLPPLRVTGRKIQANIQRARAGRSGIRFGGVTAALIVADVAVAVTAVGFGVGLGDRVRDSSMDTGQVGVAAEEYLRTEITLPVGEGGPLPGVDAFGTDIESPEFARRGVTLSAGIGIATVIGHVSGFTPTRRALRIQPTEALRGGRMSRHAHDPVTEARRGPLEQRRAPTG